MTPITFMVNVHNEAPRLHYILPPALKWADEAIVIDKGSDDATPELLKSYPVKVVNVGKSLEGEDDRAEWIKYSSNDWIYWGTPSEIPTRKCIEECKRLSLEDYDLITVPRKMYMLGVHSKFSPWYVSNYKFFFNRKYTEVSNKIHHNFRAKRGREGHVKYAEDCCVYHLTYTSCKYWINTMVDYWQTEAMCSDNPAADIDRCMAAS